MEKDKDKSSQEQNVQKPVINDSTDMLRGLFDLSGDKILERIMGQDNARQLVQQLPQEDFFWLVKKVGEDELLPLLKMSSDDQKQYLLDLESWQKDTVDLDKTSRWLDRLHKADPKVLAKWLFSRGESLAYFYLFKKIQVETKDEDDDYRHIEENLFTLDGIFHVRIPEDEHKDTIAGILRAMSKEDFNKYQSLLLNLAGVIPAEMEEEMYRLRNVRLAEHGFLPIEEALVVYSKLDPESLKAEEVEDLGKFDDVYRDLIPIFPLYYGRGRNLLIEAWSEIKDGLFLDRLRLEFAGLCNQIMSADGTPEYEIDTLMMVCRKAVAHLNLALEKQCGRDIPRAVLLLRANPLVRLFRVGFGLVLKLRWEAERWLKNTWFHSQGLDLGFWGEQWGSILDGILKDKPKLHIGLKENIEYRDFERLSEIDDCRAFIHRLNALDRMLAHLVERYPMERDAYDDFTPTFHQLLFTFWARSLLNLEKCFSALSSEQIKTFFTRIRSGEKTPPFRMGGFKDLFIGDFMAGSSEFDPEVAVELKNALAIIWQEFCEEYEQVPTQDLQAKYSRYILLVN